MKLILENWRGYEKQVLYEQEFESFFNEHFHILDEGFVDWVVEKGNSAKEAVMNVIDGIKDWSHEKIVEFVKFMGNKMIEFIGELRSRGIFKKYQARNETVSMKLLMTNKHIDLAVVVFSAIAKLTGGFLADKVIKMPGILEKLMKIFEDPVSAINDILGDTSDIVDLIKRFIEYRKDRQTTSAGFQQWQDFGGLAEWSLK